MRVSLDGREKTVKDWAPSTPTEVMISTQQHWAHDDSVVRVWEKKKNLRHLLRLIPLWMLEPRGEFARSLTSSVPSKSWHKKWWTNLYAPTLTFLNRCAPWSGGSIRDRRWHFTCQQGKPLIVFSFHLRGSQRQTPVAGGYCLSHICWPGQNPLRTHWLWEELQSLPVFRHSFLRD